MKRIARILLVILLVPVVAYAVLALVVGRDRVWETAFGAPHRPPIEFRGLSLADDARPNRFLMCPPGLCAGPVHAESPTFRVAAKDLMAAWDRAIARRPDILKLGEDGALLQAEYETRTPYMRFPDTVTVRFIPTEDGGSTLAVFSRAHYGYRDFGTNERRVREWVDALRKELGA